ncbi:MAG: hypothetical protein MUE85_21875, partial [Microscillaceae bacterium]|nr:hypothetical protein [Microscillaceae bacterium]
SRGNIKKVKISDHKKIIFGLKFIHRNYGAGSKIYSDMGDYNFILNDKYEMDNLISFLKRNYPNVL